MNVSIAQINLWADRVHDALHCECGKESCQREAEAALDAILRNVRPEPGVGEVSTDPRTAR